MDSNNRSKSSSFPFELQSFVPSPVACNIEVKDEITYHLGNLVKQDFWRERRSEIDNASDIRREHQFPLSRIRRIAKSNEKVERIAADATILLAKASEFFVMEVTSQAWFNKEEGRCHILQNWDIGRALGENSCKNFLAHIVHANPRKKATRHLIETMFPCDYPLQWQNLNPPQELNLFKENDPSLRNPMHSLNRKPGEPWESSSQMDPDMDEEFMALETFLS